jgi:hypothetical protein
MDAGPAWTVAEGARAVLLGLTGRRFGCWTADLGRVHTVVSVSAHSDWIAAAVAATEQAQSNTELIILLEMEYRLKVKQV